ncbi:MAG: hypothetical protein WC538_02340 [Thermoanaerobaculia bacterium]|jgi:hypothetical protein
MATRYFSERERGDPERDEPEIGDRFWGGFVCEVQALLSQGALEKFAESCPDGGLVAQADGVAVGHTFRAHLDIDWPLSSATTPVTLDILDAVEFFGRFVAVPVNLSVHSYFRHNDVGGFDREHGLTSYREAINLLFRRCRHPFMLDANDPPAVQRIPPAGLRELFDSGLAPSGDDQLDELLRVTRGKFLSPNAATRRESLEQLWDAFERVKTILPGDKQASVQKLLVLACSEPVMSDRLNAEMRALTAIGNDFRIRHHETDKTEIQASEHVDYLYHRMYALLVMLVRALRKGP